MCVNRYTISAFIKNQHQKLRNKNFFGEETEGDAKVQADEICSNSQNTQMEGDILCSSQLSPCHNLINGECSTSEKDEDSGNMSANKSKTKEITESVMDSLINPFLTKENKTNEIQESAKCSSEIMCPTEANKPNESPAMMFPASAKHDVPNEKEKECFEISDEECSYMSLSDSSDSELENPFSRNPENTNAKVDRYSFNTSKHKKQDIKINETKEVQESVTCSLVNPFPIKFNKTNKVKESAKCKPKSMCPSEANKPDESPAIMFPASAKHDVPNEKEKECLEIGDEECGYQSLSDSSDSELENPFSRNPENTNVKVDKHSFNNSNDQKLEIKIDETEEVKEPVTDSLINPFPTEESKSNEIQESAKCSSETMCPTEANKPDESPAMMFPASAKHDVPNEKEKECFEISDEECGYQRLSDSSDSELENPFIRKPENMNVEVDKQSFDNSKDQIGEMSSDESNKITVKHVETSNNGSKEIESEETIECRKRAKQEAASQQKSPVSWEKAVSESKHLGTYKTTEGRLGYITAELHVATSPSSVDEAIIKEEDSSNGQCYISDDEVTMETDGSTKGSAMQQKSSPPSPNHLPEMSSESEWEEMSRFPGLYLFVSNVIYCFILVKNINVHETLLFLKSIFIL